MCLENINISVLRKCRKQLGFSICDIESKVEAIAEIEKGYKKPTFGELDLLANIYCVPRWVFVSKKLPERYCFSKKIPFIFHRFLERGENILSNPEIRVLLFQVMLHRDFILELQDDLDESINKFNPPVYFRGVDLDWFSEKIMSWLNMKDGFDFQQCREKLEEKGIFVFVTGKNSGWFSVGKNSFRGLAVYKMNVPVIIINGLYEQRDQLFTLLYKFGHLIREKSGFDGFSEGGEKLNRWCYGLAETLCKKELNENNNKEKGTCSFVGNQGMSAFNRYGSLYSRVLFQCYYNGEISLHKLSKAFGLESVSEVLNLEKGLQQRGEEKRVLAFVPY